MYRCKTSPPACTFPLVGERPQRARQLWRWMYHDNFWARSIDETADQQDGFSEAYRWDFSSICRKIAQRQCSHLAVGLVLEYTGAMVQWACKDVTR